MTLLQPILAHTPIWVWVILAYLITRGVAAMRPGQTSLRRLAIVPALFTVWGIWSISHRYGGSLVAWSEWLAGICAGAMIGWVLLRRATLTVNEATGRLWRSADYSLLPLLLVTFLVKYGFEVALAVSPALSANGSFSAAYLLLSGGFTGVFVGKYLRYLSVLRKGMPGTLGPVH